MVSQVGSDELVATLDVIIECFPGQVSPYAQGVCVRLADSFVRLAQGCDEDGASEENSSLAASQCCSAIATLLDSIKGQPHVFTSLEEPLVGLLTQDPGSTWGAFPTATGRSR
ncbi:hypothetical protein T484DRAFT_1784780 [Baffinella frigidus]|nr:hypothetical protein T484DRAFT_1784780 [Cryptophyta sp. CCMP2293]